MTTSFRFSRAQHLKRQSDFLRVLKGVRESRGPLIVNATPSPEGIRKTRLGIRIGRRVGSAPVRNRIKRLLREAFRLSQHEWTRALDIVITVKPHEPLALVEYQSLLRFLQEKVLARAV